jgi:hypothetical protein
VLEWLDHCWAGSDTIGPRYSSSWVSAVFLGRSLCFTMRSSEYANGLIGFTGSFLRRSRGLLSPRKRGPQVDRRPRRFSTKFSLITLEDVTPFFYESPGVFYDLSAGISFTVIGKLRLFEERFISVSDEGEPVSRLSLN